MSSLSSSTRFPARSAELKAIPVMLRPGLLSPVVVSGYRFHHRPLDMPSDHISAALPSPGFTLMSAARLRSGMIE